jgi:hypothetical protein
MPIISTNFHIMQVSGNYLSGIPTILAAMPAQCVASAGLQTPKVAPFRFDLARTCRKLGHSQMESFGMKSASFIRQSVHVVTPRSHRSTLKVFRFGLVWFGLAC